MKKLLVILLCFSLCNIAFGQKNLEYGAHYSILSSFGIQFPFGNFAKKIWMMVIMHRLELI